MAPDFALDALDGSVVKLSDLRGQPVFLNFWATWCTPCKVEMPEIEQIHQIYQDRGLIVLGIDAQEPATKVKDFAAQSPYTWRFVLDLTGETMRRYRVTGLPTSFFIDRNGVIRGIVVGAATRSAMDARVQELLR